MRNTRGVFNHNKGVSTACLGALEASVQAEDCFIKQQKLDRALMEVTSRGMLGISGVSCHGFQCLTEVERRLVGDCATCLGSRQQILMPAMARPDYTSDDPPKRKAPVGSAADCTDLDVQMFCLEHVCFVVGRTHSRWHLFLTF